MTNEKKTSRVKTIFESMTNLTLGFLGFFLLIVALMFYSDYRDKKDFEGVSDQELCSAAISKNNLSPLGYSWASNESKEVVLEAKIARDRSLSIPKCMELLNIRSNQN